MVICHCWLHNTWCLTKLPLRPVWHCTRNTHPCTLVPTPPQHTHTTPTTHHTHRTHTYTQRDTCALASHVFFLCVNVRGYIIIIDKRIWGTQINVIADEKCRSAQENIWKLRAFDVRAAIVPMIILTTCATERKYELSSTIVWPLVLYELANNDQFEDTKAVCSVCDCIVSITPSPDPDSIIRSWRMLELLSVLVLDPGNYPIDGGQIWQKFQTKMLIARAPSHFSAPFIQLRTWDGSWGPMPFKSELISEG